MSCHLIAVAADLHCGSTVGLCPPEGLELDDGGWYRPSPAQEWLWARWQDAWDEAARIKRTENATFHLVCNGDLIDGDHHRTSQIASVLTGVHLRCAVDSLRVPLALKPSSVHVLRGTPSHVGRSGEVEEGIARVLKAEGWPVVGDPDNPNTVSSYWRRLTFGGTRFDFRHHGRMGQRSHTRGSYLRLYAHDIWAEAVKRGDDPPHIAVRSHNHIAGDSGNDLDCPTRVIATPAFQLATDYVYKLGVERLADIGIVLVLVKDGEAWPRIIRYVPERPSEMEVA